MSLLLLCSLFITFIIIIIIIIIIIFFFFFFFFFLFFLGRPLALATKLWPNDQIWPGKSYRRRTKTHNKTSPEVKVAVAAARRGGHTRIARAHGGPA